MEMYQHPIIKLGNHCRYLTGYLMSKRSLYYTCTINAHYVLLSNRINSTETEASYLVTFSIYSLKLKKEKS